MNRESGTVSVNELLSMKFRELPLSRKFQLVLGKVPYSKQWLMLLHGTPGSGKSTYSLVLAKELSKFGNILYANFEEAVGPTLQKKIEVAKLRNEKIKFLGNNTVSELWRQLNNGIYKYCIVDSISEVAKSEKKVSEFGSKLREYPFTSFILIGHATKAQNGKNESDYKGVSTLGHLIDINQRIVNGVAWNDKNRFLGKDCSKAHGYNFFKNNLTMIKNKNK
jgi:predicted ATP-dependent serine protease